VKARLAILFALAVAGCGDADTDARLDVARIYMGVSCPTPNSIRCDRVGLAVWSPSRFPRLEATIAGRPVTLTRKAVTRRLNYYEGFLTPAGLLDGGLRVRPDGGRYRWTGRHPRAATVVLVAPGRRRWVKRRVYLAAGWG
jgi:hypothetical protein